MTNDDLENQYIITVTLRNLERSYGNAIGFVVPSIEPNEPVGCFRTVWGTEDPYCYVIPRRFLTARPSSRFPLDAAIASQAEALVSCKISWCRNAPRPCTPEPAIGERVESETALNFDISHPIQNDLRNATEPLMSDEEIQEYEAEHSEEEGSSIYAQNNSDVTASFTDEPPNGETSGPLTTEDMEHQPMPDEVLTEFGDDGTAEGDQELEYESDEDPAKALERSFYSWMLGRPEQQVNPFPTALAATFECYQPPLNHLNFALQPTPYKSSTPPAVSMWAATSYAANHPQHEMKDIGGFTYKSILAAQAAKYVDPFVYHGPPNMLKERGSRLQEGVTGLVTKTYLQLGSWLQEEELPDDDVTCVISVDTPHWSNLTLPVWHLTPSFIVYEPNGCGDHAIPAVPWAKHSHRAEWNPLRRLKSTHEVWKPAGPSNLRHVQTADCEESESGEGSTLGSEQGSVFSAEERETETPDSAQEMDDAIEEEQSGSDEARSCSQEQFDVAKDALITRSDEDLKAAADEYKDCSGNDEDAVPDQEASTKPHEVLNYTTGKSNAEDGLPPSIITASGDVIREGYEDDPKLDPPSSELVVRANEEEVRPRPQPKGLEGKETCNQEQVRCEVPVGKWLTYGAVAAYVGFCVWRRFR